MSDDGGYDEFADLIGPTADIARAYYDIGQGQHVSAIVWGSGEPELVLLHGRGQNAHTWDSVARAVEMPVIAIDLPGHGHSDWRDDHDYGAAANAVAVAAVMNQAAKKAEAVVGMSLGGKTNISLAAQYPQLVRRAVVVDSTPADRRQRPALTAAQRGATALFELPPVFTSFDEMLQVTAAAIPGRSAESLRRGVRNNSHQLHDGRWAWRYDPNRTEGSERVVDASWLWDDLATIRAPIMLVCAGKSGRVLPEDIDEFCRRQPTTRVEHIDDSGHSVQSDQPARLAGLIQDFLSETSTT